jgi:phage shock protein PspC (stress-responsive transcriptional regulator)
VSDPPPTDEHRPQPAPGPGPAPKWWRSPENRYLAGVAGGLGERFDVDPLFIRVGLVIATLVSASDDGFSIVPLLYGLAWVCLPADRERPLLSRAHEPAARRETAGAIALVLAAAVLLPRLGPGGSTGLRFGVVLLGLAILLLSSRGGDDGGGAVPGGPRRRSAGAPPSPPAAGGRSAGPDGEAEAGGGEGPTTPADGAWPAGPTSDVTRIPPTGGTPGGTAGERVDRTSGRWSPAADEPSSWWSPASTRRPRWRWTSPTSSSRPDRPPRPPKRAPALWPLTIALLALVAVVWVILDVGLGFGVPPGLALSVALLVVGGVLVLSAWRGHARGTIVLGLALLPFWLAFSPGDVERFSGVGDRLFRPQTVAEADRGHELGYGRLVLDLRDVDLRPGEVLRTGVSVTGGVARVRVPADAKLEVHGRVGMGSVRIEADEPRRFDEQLAVNRSITWSSGPQPRHCDTHAVNAFDLSFADGTFASFGDLAAELERRGWEAPSRPRFDEDYGYDVVNVAVDPNWALCDPSLPDVPADPATVVVDLNLGLADLEVTRVPVD